VAQVRDDGGRVAVVRRPRANEAAVAALARHDAVLRRLQGCPAVPRRLAAGDDAHGPFTVETFAHGLSLASLVEQAGGLPPVMVMTIARASFAALAELQAAADADGPLGFVHADLGPDHLFVAPRPEAGVTFIDFGLAHLRGLTPLSHDVRGTMPFVAPERARGEGLPAPSADVFALAAAFLFALTGSPPAPSNPASLVELGERGLDLSPLAAAPGPLSQVLRDALAFAPNRRPKAAEIAARLTSG